MIDLHVHSNRSDGTYTPTELVDLAIEKGLTAFALTDHDTVAGVEEALFYARQLKASKQAAPEIIAGIEFSTVYNGRDIHILGLGFDHKSPAFAEYLQKFLDSRSIRNQKLCARLTEVTGLEITPEKLREAYPGAVLTRAHFGKYLVKLGIAKDIPEAFDRYLGDSAPCFVPREKVTPAQAIELILTAGGIPVLAHPFQYALSDTDLEKLVAQLKEEGLIGLEAIYTSHDAAQERYLRGLAAKYRLLISGGSDFHGSTRPDVHMGQGRGKLYIHESVWEDLKKAQKKLLFTDMDGTLLLNNSTISPAMKESIRKMTAAGHHLILSSGRPLPGILHVCDQEDLHFPNMLIISNNGGLVYDCDLEKPIYERKIPQADVAKIEAYANAAGIFIQGYTTREIVCYGECPELTFYTSKVDMPKIFVESIAQALPEGSYKLQTIHLSDRSRLEALRETLLADPDLGPRIHAIFSNDKYLEIMPANVDKGKALHFVTDYFPVLRTNSFAAGDAENDLSMLDAAYIAVAMQNATDEVKRHADIITEKSNDESGLIEIIEKYFQ